jgi:hypothetical protein
LRKGFPLTPTANTSSTPEDGMLYPTEWQPVKFIDPESIEGTVNFEYRQLSEDTYEIRSHISVIMVNKEGYTLFLDNDNPRAWNEWLRLNGKSVKREDL